MSLPRHLQQLRCLRTHLAVLPVCGSASLPRVPLCCHVWKQAAALMYNTSLDPCFWYGCWQYGVEGGRERELMPKTWHLFGITSLAGQKRACLAFYLWSGVSIWVVGLFFAFGSNGSIQTKRVADSFRGICSEIYVLYGPYQILLEQKRLSHVVVYVLKFSVVFLGVILPFCVWVFKPWDLFWLNDWFGKCQHIFSHISTSCD